MSFRITFYKEKKAGKSFVENKNIYIKARIHCEIFLSDYFMKHSLMHILLHLI